MLTKEDEEFILFWEKNRIREKGIFRQLSLGLPLGVLISIGIILNFMTGWYSRANMVANSQSTPLVLIFAIVLIAVFCSIFYKQHQWEMNEQRFIELKIKKDKEKSSSEKQQD